MILAAAQIGLLGLSESDFFERQNFYVVKAFLFFLTGLFLLAASGCYFTIALDNVH